jgi:small conductance mechanosensitive channel
VIADDRNRANPLGGRPRWLFSSAPHVLAALAFVIAGAWLSRTCERAVLRLTDSRLGVDPTLRGVLGSGARYLVLLLFLVAAISQLGFQVSSILAVLATAGLAVGLALQATLSNIAAGIMLLWLRPFKVGDHIEVGTISGKVFEVGLFATEIHSADGVYQFVPNSELWNRRLTNYSRLPRRLVTVRVKLWDVDAIERIRKWLADDIEKDTRVLAEPKPDVIVSELADNCITLTVQAWTATDQYGAVLRDVTNKLPSIIQQSDASSISR